MANVDIRTEPIEFNLHGVSGDVPDRNYGKAGFKLMEGLWPVIKEKDIKTTGINYWFYNGATRLSTCVELVDESDLFEHVPVRFEKYAYYKHIGPYERLGESYAALNADIAARGLSTNGLSLERYGDWTDDASQLVTEIYIGLR